MTRLFGLLSAFLLVLGLVAAPAWAQLPFTQASQQAAEDPPSAEDSLRTLLDVLRDDAAREALIEELERRVDTGIEEPEAFSSPDLRAFGGWIADATRGGAEGLAASLSSAFAQILAAPQLFSTLSVADLRMLGALVFDLSALVLITYGGYLLMRLLTERLRIALRLSLREGHWGGKILAVFISFFIDMICALLPWALGYVVALSALGPAGEISFVHSLYLNAFLVIEVILALMRGILAPQRENARLVSMTTRTARTVMAWARAFASLLVYGQLLVLPLVMRTLAPGTAHAVAILGLMVVLGLAGLAIWRAHAPVSHWLVKRLPPRLRKKLKFLIRYWHVPALIYLAALFVLALTRPIVEFYAILLTNGQIALAIFLGLVVADVLDRMIGEGIHLPGGVRQKVPLLEARLNSFVPRLLGVLRLLVVLTVVIFCLHTLGAMDFFAMLETQLGARLAGALITVAMIVLVSFLVWLLLSSWVDYRINPDFAVPVSARERTLLILMRNAATITLIVIALMFILSEIGINIAPLLASAGVIGLAIGFGAQKAVQDIITGIFIQLEGAMDVGDVVEIGGITGVVERLTIRSASLRDLEGSYHLIPFSSVDTVTNFMRGFSYALIDMRVAYREDVELARQALFDALAELYKDPEWRPFIIDKELEWMGIDSFAPNEVILRARIKTMAGKQWAVRRAYNIVVKRIFDARGIEIPVPHQKVYFGDTPKRFNTDSDPA